MTFEIAVGPRRLTINQGHAFLTSDSDGQIPWPTDHGLYFFDTRLISSWNIYANGESWELLNSAPIESFACRVFLTNKKFFTESGEIPEKSLGLTVSRAIDGGLHEDLDIVNHGEHTVRFNLEIEIRSDFADLFEVKSHRIVRRGRIKTSWREDASELCIDYSHKDFGRRITVRSVRAGSQPVYANGRLSFDVELSRKARWHSCLFYELTAGDVRVEAPPQCIGEVSDTSVKKRIRRWQQTVLKLKAKDDNFQSLFRQAVDDMVCLRFPTSDETHTQFVPAAGVPWFVALFGRDSLIASLQNALVHPDFARATLKALEKYQAHITDNYTDAEPGKIMHELRLGELAHFHLTPHTPYYGTADATPLYLVVLHSAWKCTGDHSLLDQHLETAERCLDWIDKYGDRDGDGFQEYQTRSSAGYENQGWKDAGEAVVYPDGSLVKGPKALCELQGYVYDAWQRMAEIYDALDKREKAASLRKKAKVLFQRFNEEFWDEELGFYVFGLDGDKKKIRTVASNPGHCLWSGIVEPDRAKRVVSRFRQSDMWSGWGIRTLSANNPSFNPYSYQNGSVWPHDNGIIAMGFCRYGFKREALDIISDVARAGSYFTLDRIPELYAGISRTPTDFPVQYLGANVPQAWAAGCVFHFLQAMLGLSPDAVRGKLYLDPVLPEWLPELTLSDLRVGQQCFDLKFWRSNEHTNWQVLKGDSGNVVARSFVTKQDLR